MNCTGSSFSQLRLSCSFSSMVSIPFIELSFSLHRLLFHFFLPAQLNNCITKSVLVNYRSMNMTTKREKTALMPQSNYSIALQNQQHKVKLLMRCISQFLHIPSLISRLTFSLIAHVSVPRLFFLISHSPAFFGLYVKAPKEKEVAWPMKGEMASLMLLSSVTLNDSFHLTQRWPTQFPTGLAMPADVLDVQQLDWLILHSVQAPRLSDPNQWLIQKHIQSACHSSRMEKKRGKNWGQLDVMW